MAGGRPTASGVPATRSRGSQDSILAVSTFTDWYAGSGVGVKLAVIGWHTGVLGKLVFFIGIAIVALVWLRASGFDLPSSAPESLVVLGAGIARDGVRPDPRDLDPGCRPACRQSGHRDLDQPGRRTHRHRRRAATGGRRPLAPTDRDYVVLSGRGVVLSGRGVVLSGRWGPQEARAFKRIRIAQPIADPSSAPPRTSSG